MQANGPKAETALAEHDLEVSATYRVGLVLRPLQHAAVHCRLLCHTTEHRTSYDMRRSGLHMLRHMAAWLRDQLLDSAERSF